jgi:hypothetical protein
MGRVKVWKVGDDFVSAWQISTIFDINGDRSGHPGRPVARPADRPGRTGRVAGGLGPATGEPGCRVPPALLPEAQARREGAYALWRAATRAGSEAATGNETPRKPGSRSRRPDGAGRTGPKRPRAGRARSSVQDVDCGLAGGSSAPAPPGCVRLGRPIPGQGARVADPCQGFPLPFPARAPPRPGFPIPRHFQTLRLSTTARLMISGSLWRAWRRLPHAAEHSSWSRRRWKRKRHPTVPSSRENANNRRRWEWHRPSGSFKFCRRNPQIFA